MTEALSSTLDYSGELDSLGLDDADDYFALNTSQAPLNGGSDSESDTESQSSTEEDAAVDRDLGGLVEADDACRTFDVPVSPPFPEHGARFSVADAIYLAVVAFASITRTRPLRFPLSRRISRLARCSRPFRPGRFECALPVIEGQRLTLTHCSPGSIDRPTRCFQRCRRRNERSSLASAKGSGGQRSSTLGLLVRAQATLFPSDQLTLSSRREVACPSGLPEGALEAFGAAVPLARIRRHDSTALRPAAKEATGDGREEADDSGVDKKALSRFDLVLLDVDQGRSRDGIPSHSPCRRLTMLASTDLGQLETPNSPAQAPRLLDDLDGKPANDSFSLSHLATSRRLAYIAIGASQHSSLQNLLSSSNSLRRLDLANGHPAVIFADGDAVGDIDYPRSAFWDGEEESADSQAEM